MLLGIIIIDVRELHLSRMYLTLGIVHNFIVQRFIERFRFFFVVVVFFSRYLLFMNNYFNFIVSMFNTIFCGLYWEITTIFHFIFGLYSLLGFASQTFTLALNWHWHLIDRKNSWSTLFTCTTIENGYCSTHENTRFSFHFPHLKLCVCEYGFTSAYRCLFILFLFPFCVTVFLFCF